MTPLAKGLALAAGAAILPALASENVSHWAPARISSPVFESHAAFDPLTGDLVFVRSPKEFRGWHLLVSHCGPLGWSEPQPPAFAAPERSDQRERQRNRRRILTGGVATSYRRADRTRSNRHRDGLESWPPSCPRS